MPTEQDRGFMLKAIDLMRKAGVMEKTGGPFGAVIVKGGEMVAAGGNWVLADKDPTAHAEVMAIRNACKNLGTHILSGAVMYTACACCPLCYAAAYWARIDKVFYGAECDDYKDIFDDSAMYIDFELPFHNRNLK